MKNKILEVKELYCGYNKKQPILKNINFSIYDNEFIGLIGPNASGKTTLLKTILGIIKPISGRILKKESLKFGYVPQIFTIDETFPFSVYEILSFAFLKNFKQNLSPQEKKKIDEMINKFKINEIKFTLYRELSGGLKQKVLIIRSLLRQPDILILDEPTNDLDIENTKTILDFLKEIKKQEKFTVILTSHTLETVLNYSEKLFLVNTGYIEVIENINDHDSLQQKISDVFKLKTKIFEFENWKFIKL